MAIQCPRHCSSKLSRPRAPSPCRARAHWQAASSGPPLLRPPHPSFPLLKWARIFLLLPPLPPLCPVGQNFSNPLVLLLCLKEKEVDSLMSLVDPS